MHRRGSSRVFAAGTYIERYWSRVCVRAHVFVQVEPYDYNYKGVYVWHTKTKEPLLNAEHRARSDPSFEV